MCYHDLGSNYKGMSKGKELRFDLTSAICYSIASSHSQTFYNNCRQSIALPFSLRISKDISISCCTIISLSPFCWHFQYICHDFWLWRNAFFVFTSDCIVLVKHAPETSCMNTTTVCTNIQTIRMKSSQISILLQVSFLSRHPGYCSWNKRL